MRNLENFLEKYIEGFFNKKFSSRLQPLEVAGRLVKEMDRRRTVGVSQTYVPNAYTIYLAREDYGRMQPYGEQVRRELAAHLAREARRRALTIAGGPAVTLALDETMARGGFRVESAFKEPPPEEDGAPPADASATLDRLMETKVFDKMELAERERNARPRELAVLTVTQGEEAGRRCALGYGRVNIGRRENNELPLADMNASRLHAYIVCEGGRHVLHDAGSLNGTYVNGRRIARRQLADGDRIKVGNTAMAYEVK